MRGDLLQFFEFATVQPDSTGLQANINVNVVIRLEPDLLEVLCAHRARVRGFRGVRDRGLERRNVLSEERQNAELASIEPNP